MGEFRLNPETLSFSVIAKDSVECKACSNKSESMASFPFKKDYVRIYEVKDTVQPSNYSLNGQFFKSSVGHGYEEIIVDSPAHGDKFNEYSIEETELLFNIIDKRVAEILKYNIGKNICITRNLNGHGYFDLLALPIPKVEERNCFQCDYVKRVDNREVHRTETVSAYVPFTPMSDVQINITPVKHVSIVDIDPVILFDMSSTLKKVLAQFKDNNVTVALMEHGDGHFHLEVHGGKLDGFELLGIERITVAPEMLAKELREKLGYDKKDK